MKPKDIEKNNLSVQQENSQKNLSEHTPKTEVLSEHDLDTIAGGISNPHAPKFHCEDHIYSKDHCGMGCRYFDIEYNLCHRFNVHLDH